MTGDPIIGTTASRLANRENIFPSSDSVTYLDNIDLITTEEKKSRKPHTEPTYKTHPVKCKGS